MALSTNPDLIIADEPTTSLDVTIEAQVIQLLKRLQTEFGKSVIVISHNLGVVASLCDRIAVMYGGKIVEKGSADDIFYNPRHPYTWGLLRSIPGSKISKEKNLYRLKELLLIYSAPLSVVRLQQDVNML